MSFLWAIFWKELKLLLRDRTAFLWMILLPVSVIFVSSSALSSTFDGGDFEVSLPIHDLDQSEQSRLVILSLENSGVIEVVDGLNEQQIKDSIDDGDYSVGLVIPAGYQERIEQGESTQLAFYTNPNDSTSISVVRSVLEAVVAEVNSQALAVETGLTYLSQEQELPFDSEAGEEALATISVLARQLATQPAVRLQESSATDNEDEVDPFAQNVPGYALMFMLFGVTAGVESILREREEGTLKRLLTTPLPKWAFLTGKLLANFVIGLLQVAIIFGFAFAFFNLDMGGQWLAIFFIVFLSVFAANAISIFLASLVQTRRQLSPIATFVVLISSALGGAWWPLWITPEWLQDLGKVSLVAWAMEAFNELSIFGGELIDIWPNLLALFLYGVVMYGVGIWLFRFQEK